MIIGISSAAFSVIIIFVVLNYWGFSQKLSSGEVFNKYYSEAKYDNATRGTVPDAVNDFDSYLILYQSRKYKEALNGFGSVSEKSDLYMPAKYFAANCHMHLSNYRQAADEFSVIIKNSESLFYYDALWYAGLCYLKLNDNEKAKEYFTILTNEKNCYSEKAMAIITEL